MNPVHNKYFMQVTIVCMIFVFSMPALALKSDMQQPVTITSVKQSIYLEKNITTFTDDVVIRQGSIDIRANTVIVTRFSKNVGKIIIEAFGAPVTFYQLQDNDKPVNGYSTKVRYEVDKELLTLTGNVYLEQLECNIKSDKIIYIISTQQMQAFSNKGKRVTTVLLPSQLQDKDLKETNKKSKQTLWLH
ncbi:Lipopolysaccharide export system protein LptA [Candidatus Hartigia pinicola]|nr:Lipopolysaccharide export system protein LptA [Candidatus Hartigia pinicola]